MSLPENFIVAPVVLPCWRCGTDTRFIEVHFEAPLHPGVCEAWAWALYDETNRLQQKLGAQPTYVEIDGVRRPDLERESIWP